MKVFRGAAERNAVRLQVRQLAVELKITIKLCKTNAAESGDNSL